ncbi:MAG: carboxymuconolactone decarboxylase family protein [Nitrospirae bacterium]|nr:carboxymuconolactone decarboxylase family protein [Nitrospirota bacterium]
MTAYPKNYLRIQKRFPELMKAQEEAGRLSKEAGPIDEKTCNLLQLAACVALHSEGGVHSHVRRAVKAGASKDEVYHAVAVLMNTVGFPTVAAAISWISDLCEKK